MYLISDHTSAQALAAIQNAGFELIHHPPYSPFVFVLHGKWLAGRPRTTILLQRNQSFGEMLDQVHFSCRRICRKVTKYDLLISYRSTNFLNAPRNPPREFCWCFRNECMKLFATVKHFTTKFCLNISENYKIMLNYDKKHPAGVERAENIA